MNNPHQIVDISAAIFKEAAERDVMPARIAIERNCYNGAGTIHYWNEPALSTSTDAELPSSIKLVSDCMLSQVAATISKTIQFPVNTIFAHAMGIVASAMSKSFKFEYGHGVKPVNLYVVTAQPPSSGKSGVNDLLAEPVHSAFDAINLTATKSRKIIKVAIIAVKKEISNAKKGTASITEEELYALEDKLSKLYEKHDNHIVYTYALDDATPEALAKIALKQNGLFNIISAEADAINVILGGVYSDKKANYGIFLKGWDAERHQVARSNQETISGHVIGNIAVIAQDESIRTILEAGESGRGISERFLLVRENTWLGRRSFGKSVPLDDELMAQYGNTIFNIVKEDSVTLTFTKKSHEIINSYRREIEPKMGDHGEYSNNMMRGFIGKADKQIMKISSILHVIENWRDGGERESEVQDKTVKNGLRIFKNVVTSYVYAADELGFTGQDSEYNKIEEKLQSYAEKGKMVVTITQLRNNIKNIKPFTGTPSLTTKLKEILLPVLEQNGLCITYKNKIYINPHLKG